LIGRGKTGPKGHSHVLIGAIVPMKHRDPGWGCPRMAAQIPLVFELKIDKGVVQRFLARFYRPTPIGSWPSWPKKLKESLQIPAFNTAKMYKNKKYYTTNLLFYNS
jgi:hypothetical protein